MHKRRAFRPLSVCSEGGHSNLRELLPTGFTLIELLVVISIIAVLMSILMPALDRVKKQVRSIMCRSNLHEWGIVFMMYTSENDGHFQKGWVEDAGGYAGGHCWPDTVWPYYENVKLRFCPTAKRSLSVERRKTFWAWIEPDTMVPGQFYKAEGSYGLNEWVGNPPVDFGPTSLHNFRDNSWRTPNVKSAAKIPLMSDCCWAGGFPHHSDTPPEYPDDIWLGGNELRRWCIDRHGGYINSVFVDWSVRKVGLKQLWKQKWGRAFNTQMGPTEWPEWMAKLKE